MVADRSHSCLYMDKYFDLIRTFTGTGSRLQVIFVQDISQ